jgi:uncharacterized protein YndB with AHSA1/START domain
MPADRIEREIEIEAPIDVVWAVLTEPGHIASWFTDEAQLDARPGGDGRFVFRERATSRPSIVDLRVEEIDPPRFFSFRWAHPEGAEPDETNSLLVQFSLEAAGDATRLRLVESGFDRLARPDAERERQNADHQNGWDVHLASLRDYAAAERRSAAAR